MELHTQIPHQIRSVLFGMRFLQRRLSFAAMCLFIGLTQLYSGVLLQEHTEESKQNKAALGEEVYALSGKVASLTGFEVATNPFGWMNWLNYSEVVVETTSIKGVIGNSGTSPVRFMTRPNAFKLPLDEYKYLELTFERESSAGDGVVYFRKDENSLATDGQRFNFPISQHDGKVTVILDASEISAWANGNLTGIGLGLHEGAGASKDYTNDRIHSIRLAIDIKQLNVEQASKASDPQAEYEESISAFKSPLVQVLDVDTGQLLDSKNNAGLEYKLGGETMDLLGLTPGNNPYKWESWSNYDSISFSSEEALATIGQNDGEPARLLSDHYAFFIDPRKFAYLELSFSRSRADGDLAIFFRIDGNSVATKGQRINVPLKAIEDDQNISVIVDLSEAESKWGNGVVTALGLDFHAGLGPAKNGSELRIHSLRLGEKLIKVSN